MGYITYKRTCRGTVGGAMWDLAVLDACRIAQLSRIRMKGRGELEGGVRMELLQLYSFVAVTVTTVERAVLNGMR